ncbi:MAG TPA: hypothetical protein DCE41_37905, partial [Cytophagales bacterium]|nr:hypothetical protein [Cytophagales bacterium]
MDLESNIRAWRRQLHRQGTFEDGHLEELESHLRDHIDHLLEGGQTKEEAFAEATRELGTALELGEEEHKARLTT